MNSTSTAIWQYTRAYLLWLISCVVGYFNFMAILPAVRRITILFGADQWSIPVVHQLSLLVFGVLAVITLFWCEARYRQASQIDLYHLLRFFGKVTGVQIGLLLIAYLVTLIPL